MTLHQPTWNVLEEGLNQEASWQSTYLHRWRLQLSIGKTMSTASELNNREVKDVSSGPTCIHCYISYLVDGMERVDLPCW